MLWSRVIESVGDGPIVRENTMAISVTEPTHLMVDENQREGEKEPDIIS